MLSSNFQLYNDMVQRICERSKELRPKPLLFYPYLRRVMDWDKRNGAAITFPYTVRIPKSNKELLKGDFEPAYTFTLQEPVCLDDEEHTPIWFTETGGGMHLRFGFVNNDARDVSAIPLDQEYIHMFLGGSSGHGKSVTLNAVIGALVHEYAPWELELHLSDAKIAEFRRYGLGHRIPHIKSIAATEDADFVRSVLDRCVTEMKERQKIFSTAGVTNLKGFREKTKLAYPQVVIIMDEVESTFKLAGKQASAIASAIDDFARLGRSSGYHVIMATQNLSSDIPKSAIGQIRIRGSLGATESVSNAILGNAGASDNFGRIGSLIINTEVLSGGDTSKHNIRFQSPFIKDEEVPKEAEFLEKAAKAVGYRASMAFYDEEDVKDVTKFDSVIDASFARMKSDGEITSACSPIVLGLPAFVCDDKDELLKLWLDHKDVENILICSTISERVAAHLHNISKSLGLSDFALQLFTTDSDLAQWVVNPLTVQEARDASKPPLSSISSLVRKRLFLLQLEHLAVNASFDREVVERIFAEVGVPQEHWGVGLLAKRCVAYNSMLSDGNQEWKDVGYLFKSFKQVYDEFVRVNCVIDVLTPDKFKPATFILGDLSKIVGYGRDPKTPYINTLKKALQDASRVGVLYVLYTRSMEGLTDLMSGLRYVIFDAPDQKDWGRTRVEEPRELKSNLALVNDAMDTGAGQKKFKRTLLHLS